MLTVLIFFLVSTIAITATKLSVGKADFQFMSVHILEKSLLNVKNAASVLHQLG